MKNVYTLFFLLIAICGNAQLLSVSPDFPKETDAGIVITLDATKGNQGLLNHSVSDVYIHIGCITSLSTSSSDWKYVPFTWGTTNASAQAVSLGNNKWKYTITGASLRAFFGITNTSEKILKIACLFRSGDGNIVQRNADGTDMYLPIYDANLNTKIVNPLRQPTYIPTPETITKNIGDVINLEAKASQTATMTLFFNGTQVNTLSGTDITASPTITTAGNQQIVARSVSGSVTQSDTMTFYVASSTTVAALPAGVVDGINYDSTGTVATLVLFAPGKNTVTVLGDFNNWTQSTAYQMNKTPDGNRFWLKITGLTAGTEYAYQYLIDNTLQLADYNTEKVLDKSVDPSIPSTTYPNLKAFPAKAAGTLASIIQTGKTPYNWQVTNFQRPDKRNLVIYELLVRDFLATSNWQTLKDTLGYLKKIGVNAIEVMPFNNFEGYSSWGYNPNFYFAPDKVYGTETALKQFIDACHQQGFAVIMDMVLNHSYGSSPMVQMYWDATKNVPAANNPWFFQYANHAYNVGYEFNHYTQATIDFTQRVTSYWLTNYKVDGYRFDLAKGFTKINTCDSLGNNCNVTAWGNYDQGRVNTWDTIYNQMQRTSANSYCILEMFADNSEEKVEADYGMMPWGDMNYNFNQATMGYATSSSDLSGALPTTYSSAAWNQPYKVVYQESHDEERLQYRNEQYANSSGSYNIKDTATGLKRNAMATAFWAMMPGPKMMWQFGELGYDYPIGLCSNGTVSSCNTDPKPIRWDYLANPNRKALHDVYAKLLALRQIPNYLSAFISKNITYSFGNKAFNSMQVSSDSLNIVVVGNFDVVGTTGTVTFQSAGTWYDYLSSATIAATGSSQSITLAPGEYHVYLNRNLNSSVVGSSYQLTSFTAVRGTANIAAAWTTANEVSMKQFELQRSTDGVNFTTINTQTAGNKTTQNYTYADTALAALNANGVLYYRLKATGNDSLITYSAIVQVAPVPSSVQVTSFIGTRNATNIALTWITANEINMKQYELQRSSDNINFITINTQVAGNKTSQTYAYADTATAALNAASTLYYRLKTTGSDGTITYTIIQVAANSTSPASYRLISFVGARSATNISIAWQTANEINEKQYELQRSTDNVNYTTIITRTAYNTASQGYGYADVDPIAINATGVLYYRLKITGNDGTVSYSSIVVQVTTIVNNSIPTIKTYPNPVNSTNLYIATNITGVKMEITVVDIVGRVLQSFSVDAGTYSGGIIPLNTSAMTNGIYILKIVANNQRYTQRFIIQH